MVNRIIGIAIVLLLAGCASTVESKHEWFKDRNVCKRLQGDVLVYPVFIKDKKGEGWTEMDRKVFLDSLKVTMSWIEGQAKLNGINLRMFADAHPKVIKKGYPGKTIRESNKMLGSATGYAKFNKFYDGIAKKVAPGIVKEETSLPKVMKLKSRERLVAKLRNVYGVESVVLLFVHKPVKQDHLFVTPNKLSNDDIEYMVTTFQSPSVLGYQILELFGACPLLYSTIDKKDKESVAIIKKHCPKDIMANISTVIQKTEVGALTSYLVGWKNECHEDFKKLRSTRDVILK